MACHDELVLSHLLLDWHGKKSMRVESNDNNMTIILELIVLFTKTICREWHSKLANPCLYDGHTSNNEDKDNTIHYLFQSNLFTIETCLKTVDLGIDGLGK